MKTFANFTNFKPARESYLTKRSIEPYTRNFVQAKFSDLGIRESLSREKFSSISLLKFQDLMQVNDLFG